MKHLIPESPLDRNSLSSQPSPSPRREFGAPKDDRSDIEPLVARASRYDARRERHRQETASPDRSLTSERAPEVRVTRLEQVTRHIFEPDSRVFPAQIPPAPSTRDAVERTSQNLVEPLVNSGISIAAARLPQVERTELRTGDSAAFRQDIQIVIGKVTVQALVPSPVAALPPPPRSTPKLTLEQYLREREGSR